jgi:hypothetical protein
LNNLNNKRNELKEKRCIFFPVLQT